MNISTQITIRYTGADIPLITLDQSIIQTTDFSYTITGTNSPLATAIAVYNNNILQGNVTITGVSWNFAVPIAEGLNAIRVEASPNPNNATSIRYATILKNYQPTTTIRYRNDELDYDNIIFYGIGNNLTEIEINGQTTRTPLSGPWEFPVTGIAIGDHTELVKAKNEYLTTNYNIRVNIKPIANLRKPCRLFAMTGPDIVYLNGYPNIKYKCISDHMSTNASMPPSGNWESYTGIDPARMWSVGQNYNTGGVLKPIKPMAMLNGISRYLKMEAAVESITQLFTGVQAVSQLGSLTLGTPTNTWMISAVPSATSSIGSLILHANRTIEFPSVQVTASLGTIVPQLPEIRQLTGVQVQSGISNLAIYLQHITSTVINLTAVSSSLNLPGGTSFYYHTEPITSIKVLSIYHSETEVWGSNGYYRLFTEVAQAGWYTIPAQNGIRVAISSHGSGLGLQGVSEVNQTITWEQVA